MRDRFAVIARTLFASLLILAFALPQNSARAQERKNPQSAGVDNTKMGPYRALAQMIYANVQKGDFATAAELSKVLERVWDKAEEYGGDTALAKTNRTLFEEIDKAMDGFITPIMEFKNKPPDAAKVKVAYAFYLEKLKQGD